MLTFGDAVYTEIGRRIAECRRGKGWTQKTLEQELSNRGCLLKRSSLAQIEKGSQRIMLHSLFYIADALGIDPSVLLPSIGDLRGDSNAQGVDTQEIEWAKSVARDTTKK